MLRLVRRHRRTLALAADRLDLCGVLGASRIRRSRRRPRLADRDCLCLRRPVRRGGDLSWLLRGTRLSIVWPMTGSAAAQIRSQDSPASLALIVCPAIVTSLLAAHLGGVWIALLCLSSPRHRRYRRPAARVPHRRAGSRHAAARGRVAARAAGRSTYCGGRLGRQPVDGDSMSRRDLDAKKALLYLTYRRSRAPSNARCWHTSDGVPPDRHS